MPFVILDEAQNTTPAQMRMVLTRLGERSRMVVTGDITQVDLPSRQLSGLVEASEVLDGVEGVAVCRLTAADVVRHPLVQRVVEAYARRDERKTPASSASIGRSTPRLNPLPAGRHVMITVTWSTCQPAAISRRRSARRNPAPSSAPMSSIKRCPTSAAAWC